MFKEIVFYFLIYSFIGWRDEVIHAALTTEKFAHRGYLSGQYCPIYGRHGFIM
ncbi:MAG: hypothetical protein GX666_13000 [Tissierellia bacterium]|nr:hypothetical protein [Tissierellia bacterium]